MAPTLRHILTHTAEFIFPTLCEHCGHHLGPPPAAYPLCPACQGAVLRAAATPACPDCGRLLAQQGDGCQQCLGKGWPHLTSVLRYTIYDAAIRDLILKAKFENRWPLAEYLGAQLAAHPQIRAAVENSDTLTAVPLHWKRLWTRTYNQSEVIAKSLAKHIPTTPYQRLLQRTKPTAPQSRQTSATARKRNVENAFSPLPNLSLTGQHIILLDDVLTTGATLSAAAKSLRQAGAKSITAIVVAIPDKRWQDE